MTQNAFEVASVRSGVCKGSSSSVNRVGLGVPSRFRRTLHSYFLTTTSILFHLEDKMDAECNNINSTEDFGAAQLKLSEAAFQFGTILVSGFLRATGLRLDKIKNLSIWILGTLT